MTTSGEGWSASSADVQPPRRSSGRRITGSCRLFLRARVTAFEADVDVVILGIYAFFALPAPIAFSDTGLLRLLYGAIHHAYRR